MKRAVTASISEFSFDALKRFGDYGYRNMSEMVDRCVKLSLGKLVEIENEKKTSLETLRAISREECKSYFDSAWEEWCNRFNDLENQFGEIQRQFDETTIKLDILKVALDNLRQNKQFVNEKLTREHRVSEIKSNPNKEEAEAPQTIPQYILEKVKVDEPYEITRELQAQTKYLPYTEQDIYQPGKPINPGAAAMPPDPNWADIPKSFPVGTTAPQETPALWEDEF